MSRSRAVLGAALAALVIAAVNGAGPAAAAGPGAGFFGVVPQAPPTPAELARMEGVVGTLRIPVYWWQCEPVAGAYDFDALDSVVGAAAERGIRVQPFVYGTPSWLSLQPARAPLSPRGRKAWADFLRALVRRYGSGGEFWHGRARREPIRDWQIWNEPNFVVFWRPQPSPAAYARLLHVSATAIRSTDRRARIVLAGVAPVSAGIRTWVFLRDLLRVPGVRRDFDLAALHPYSTSLPELDYQVNKVRRVMVDAGYGRLPLLVTEIGVASWGVYSSAFVQGPAGQARFLRRAFRRLLQMRRRWHIAGVDWFTWRDQRSLDRTCSFCQGAGLVDLEGRPKPAWWAYRQIVHAARLR
jgi:hypothetical protein